jgi:hypothetical protein
LTKDSHILALRFASKVALSTFSTLMVGCDHHSASSNEAASPTAPVQTMTVGTNNPPTAPAPSSSSSSDGTIAPASTLAPLPPSVGSKQPKVAAAARSCETVLDDAFTDRDPNLPPAKLSSQAAQCCDKVFKARAAGNVSTTPGAKHFYDCCDTTNNQARGCSPWGPPVPASIAWKPARDKKMGDVIDLRAPAKKIIQDLLSSVEAPSDPITREAAIETWRGRMINEYTSSTVFAQLADQIASVPEWKNEAAMIAEVRAFADEERRHGALCGAVVEALGGEARATEHETFTPNAFPLHEEVAPAEAVLRNVLSICCLSETVAVALIGAERLEMPEGPLRDLLTTIWSDEIGHARFGWRLVAKMSRALDEEAKRRLSQYLAVAFDHLIDHELAHLPVTAEVRENGEAYGLCNGQDARALFFATLNEVIAPRLTALGLAA